MSRLAEMDEYDSLFGRRLVDDDFLAAGYTPQEVQAYRGSIVQPSLTTQDRAAMEAQYGTLEAPDPTLRQRGAARIQDRLISAGLDPYLAGSYSRRIMGDTAPTDGGLGIGLADFTPLGAVFGVQEGSRTARAGYEQGDPVQMGLGALEAGLGILEATPLTAAIGRGIAATARRMDPNTLYSVFGPPVGNTSPLVIRPDDVYRGEGTPRITVRAANEPFVVRGTHQSQIDDMIQSGLVRPKPGGYGANNSAQLYFGESSEALPTSIFGRPSQERFVLVGDSDRLAGTEGPIPIDQLRHVWTVRDGETVDILPEILRANRDFDNTGQ